MVEVKFAYAFRVPFLLCIYASNNTLQFLAIILYGNGGRFLSSFGVCESKGKLHVHTRSRSLARWMLKELPP